MSPKGIQVWRAAFISAQSIVIGYSVLGEFGEHVIMQRHAVREFSLNPNFWMVGTGIVFYLSWAFLLFVSPFFFRSLRWIAWLGWAIALFLILYGLFISPVA